VLKYVEGVRDADGDALDVRDGLCVRLIVRVKLGVCVPVVEAVPEADADSDSV